MNKDIVLQAVNISRTYDGKVPVRALKNCSVQFERGEFAAIIGKSGSGKSTLLRILGTLDMPDEGTVKIGDIDIYGGSTRLSDRQLSQFRRRNIGFVYQDYNLFPEYTAYENIIFPVHLDKRHEDREEVMDIMEKLHREGLQQPALRHPEGQRQGAGNQPGQGSCVHLPRAPGGGGQGGGRGRKVPRQGRVHPCGHPQP